MSKFSKSLAVVAELWPLIKALVFAVEESFPDAGIGNVKLAEVLRLIREGWDRADISFADAERFISAAITTIVSLANLTKRFKNVGAGPG